MTDKDRQIATPAAATDSFLVEPVGLVRSSRTVPLDDDWDAITAEIELDRSRFSEEAVAGLEEFSHVEVVYIFHRVAPESIQTGSRHPRGNEAWPRVGVFAQRAKGRPNRLGVSICQLLAVSGLTLKVRGLDAIEGSPVIDIKPHMAEFAARGPVRQPPWTHELMAGYWGSGAGGE